jgi:very-short-patch-repair endonuclease
VLGEHVAGSTRTRSELEELFLELCRSHGLPQPLVNQFVAGYECDFVWSEARVIVETDGWAAHGRRATREKDLARDAALAAAGWRVIRLTWRRLTHEPDEVAAQLAQLLGLELAT